jgi:transcriptional regulator with XRE-family HTH domain
VASRAQFNGNILRLEIARRGLSQADLAKLAGRTEETIGQVLRGRPTTPATARAIIGALARTPALVHADLIEAAK